MAARRTEAWLPVVTGSPKTRHVWVRTATSPVEFQGFLLRWEQRDDGSWWGKVLYVSPADAEIADWFPMDRIRPVSSGPSTGSAYG